MADMAGMPVGDLSPELAVLLTAVAVLIAAMFTPHRLQWIGALLALGGLVVAGVLAAGQLGASRLTFSGTWALDGATGWGRLMILAATAFCVGLSPAWMATDRRHGEFYAMLLFSALGAMAMAGAADLLQLVMGVLLSSVTGYTLAAYHRDWALSVEAGIKYFLLGALANALLGIGVILVFGMLGASGYEGLATRASTAGSPLAYAGVGLVLVGLAFKLGAVPAHAWVPDVAEGAPVPAAALLTVVPKIAAAIALIRLVEVLAGEALAVRPFVAVLAAGTMTLGNLAALGQEDVRRLIGWSAVSQSGYALMAVAVIGLTDNALPALLFFIGAYALANLAAFAVIAHLRGRTARGDFRGLARSAPVAAAALILAFLSMVGIPPLVGFIGKLVLFRATIEGGYAWLAVIGAANSVVSLFYYARVMGPAYFAEPDGSVAMLGSSTRLAVVVGGIGLVALALVAGPLLKAFEIAAILP